MATRMGKPCHRNNLNHHLLPHIIRHILFSHFLLQLLPLPVLSKHDDAAILLGDSASSSSSSSGSGSRSNGLISSCPVECKCLDKGSILTCRHGHLVRVPSQLLSTTMFLDLDDNKMSVLRNGSVENVSRLEVLSVQANELMEVEEGE